MWIELTALSEAEIADEHKHRVEQTAVAALLDFNAAISALGLAPCQRQAVFHQFSICLHRLLSTLMTTVIIATQDHEEKLSGHNPRTLDDAEQGPYE